MGGGIPAAVLGGGEETGAAQKLIESAQETGQDPRAEGDRSVSRDGGGPEGSLLIVPSISSARKRLARAKEKETLTESERLERNRKRRLRER